MAQHEPPITERLREAPSPHDFQDWEENDGYYIATCRVSPDDIPDLIEIARKWCDPDWPSLDGGRGAELDNIELLPVTAWRALADLKCSESVEALIDVLCAPDSEFDDWATIELPHVFGRIGQPAIDSLVRLAKNTDKQDFIRSAAAEGLQHVAEYHPEARAEVVARLTEMLTNATREHVDFNSNLLVTLVELRGVEAAEAIELAFSNDCLDVGMMGDWEDVRLRLGVEGLGLEMPRHPYNSIEQLRRRMGIGVFSDKPIFNHNGEMLADAAEAYFDRAWDLFSASNKPERVVDDCDDPGWFQMLLRFGLGYLGKIVDEMTIADVDEFLFEFLPRRLSTDPEEAASIVWELTLFWEYLDRVFGLPHAKSIIEWLQSDRIVANLEVELSDPTNNGMAKSTVMTGQAAGYDTTTQHKLAEFIAAYNQSRRSEAVSTPATTVTGRPRVGRNDPCPCGSGTKFKKCCR